MPNSSLLTIPLPKGWDEWMKITVLAVVLATSFVVVREGVDNNSQAITLLQENKANRELVTAQYEAIIGQLTMLQNQMNQLQQQMLARR